MLCEWTAEGTHKNYGDGPPADEELFVEAVLDLLWKNSEQAERGMGDQARALPAAVKLRVDGVQAVAHSCSEAVRPLPVRRFAAS